MALGGKRWLKTAQEWLGVVVDDPSSRLAGGVSDHSGDGGLGQHCCHGLVVSWSRHESGLRGDGL